MKKKQLLTLMFSLMTLGLISSNTLASGTYSPGSSSGNDYHMNKLIFYKKVTCSNCPYPSRGKTALDAQALLQELNENSNLSSKQQKATMSYLQRRFKLN